jgi:hypothetical protein
MAKIFVCSEDGEGLAGAASFLGLSRRVKQAVIPCAQFLVQQVAGMASAFAALGHYIQFLTQRAQ